MSDNPKQIIEIQAKATEAVKVLDGVKQSVADLNTQIEKSNDAWLSAGATMTKVGAGLTAVLTVPIITFFSAATSTAADFEQAMAGVAAISGETGDAFVALEEQAKLLGSTTRYTAVEAAQGMVMLARAGWDAQEVLAGMPGMLNLAAAGALDLARAADIISDVMMAFGANAAEATMYADVFAMAAARANTTVEMLGAAMAYAAPAAAAAGFSIEQTAAALSALADAGIKGTRAGTTMDSVLRELRNKVKDGALDFGEFTVSVYDSAGAMRDLFSILGDVEKGMSGMTQEQRDAALSMVFTTRSLRGMNVWLTRGIDSVKELEGELINSSGAAENMAGVMMDTLQGSVIIMQSAMEGLKIAFGEAFLPYIKAVVDWVAKLVSGLANLSPATVKVITFFLAMAAAIGPLLVAFGGLLIVAAKWSILTATLSMGLANLMKTMFTFQTAIYNKIGSIIALKASYVGLKASILSTAATMKTALIAILLSVKASLINLATVVIPQAIAGFAALWVSMGPAAWVLAGIAAVGVALKVVEGRARESALAFREFNDNVSSSIGILGDSASIISGFSEQLDLQRGLVELLGTTTNETISNMAQDVAQNYLTMTDTMVDSMTNAAVKHLEALALMMEASDIYSSEDIEQMRRFIEEQYEKPLEKVVSAQKQMRDIMNDVAIDQEEKLKRIKGIWDSQLKEISDAMVNVGTSATKLGDVMTTSSATGVLQAERMLQQIVSLLDVAEQDINKKYDLIMDSIYSAWSQADTEEQKAYYDRMMDTTEVARLEDLKQLNEWGVDRLSEWQTWAEEFKKYVDQKTILEPHFELKPLIKGHDYVDLAVTQILQGMLEIEKELKEINIEIPIKTVVEVDPVEVDLDINVNDEELHGEAEESGKKFGGLFGKSIVEAAQYEYDQLPQYMQDHSEAFYALGRKDGDAYTEGFYAGLQPGSPIKIVRIIDEALKDISRLTRGFGTEFDKIAVGMNRINVQPESKIMDVTPRSIVNEFKIGNINVRDDQDIEKIARELHNLQEKSNRGVA